MYGSCHPTHNHMWKLTDSVKCEVCNQGVANVFYCEQFTNSKSIMYGSYHICENMREEHPDNNLQIQNQ